MYFIQTSCIKIPEHLQKEQWCQTIIQDLTRQSTDYNDPTIKRSVPYYDIRDGNILIPRNYNISMFGHYTIDYLSDGDSINIKFKSQPRNELQRLGLDFFKSKTKGVLKLPPGEGKTVIAIGGICSIGQKAIIYVHKDSLISQWKERFIQHSTATEDDIGILKTDQCNFILQKPIILSTVQTMSSMIDKYSDIEKILLNAKIGVAIWDECHTTTGAPEYSKSAMYTQAKRVYGLSATPARIDQNHDIIHKHIGEVYAPTGESKTLNPKIIILKFSHGTKYAKQFIYWGIEDDKGNYKLSYPRFDMTRYLKILGSSKNHSYIPIMRKILRKVYNADRIALLISDRINILDKLSSAIPKNDLGFFIPRSGKNRDSELLKKIVLSTPGSSRDGTDRQEFDCLIMANSLSNIEQAIGRICRFMPNKKEPVVFDIVDIDYQECIDRYEYRKKFYKQKNWTIEEKNIQQ